MSELEKVRLIYNSLLRRDPDIAGLHAYKGVAEQDIIESIWASEEFRANITGFLISSFAINRQMSDTLAFDAIVQREIYNSDFQNIYAQESGNEYLKYHKRRFLELFSFLKHVIDSMDNNNINVLEVGTAYYTTYYYKQLFPQLKLYTICRPVETGGPCESWAKQAGVLEHHSLDLNTVDFSEFVPRSGWNSKFDFIICCEVIEHLIRDPGDILAGLIYMLADEGKIFITTPNYFSHSNLQKIVSGHNPAPTFKDYHDNKDAHHHFREYTLQELVEYSERAGGRVSLKAYSNAWNPESYLSQKEYAFRSNLVVVVEKQGERP